MIPNMDRAITEDALLGGRVRLLQPERGYRIAIDAVLLAAAVEANPDGHVIDDIMVYRRARNRFLVVVNAANEQKDWDWLCGVNEGKYLVDRANPACRPCAPVTMLATCSPSRSVSPISRACVQNASTSSRSTISSSCVR